MRSALNTAVKRRLIDWNPALSVELPEHHRTQTDVWTGEQLAMFLAAIADERLYALFHLIAFTGMRRGEAIGLHWIDADLETGIIRVAHQVTDAGQGPRLGKPKTNAGVRLVPIDPGTVSVLEQHNNRQAAERSHAGPAWEEHGLVFTHESGKLLRPDAVTALFTRLVKRTGLPRIRLHDLRHTHASLALSAGVDIKVVSSRLGHSTTAITSDLYTHVVPELARQAADAIAGAVPAAPQLARRPVTPLLPRGGSDGLGRDPPGSKPAGQRGAGTGTRTPNRPITSRVRYQLRHAGGTLGTLAGTTS